MIFYRLEYILAFARVVNRTPCKYPRIIHRQIDPFLVPLCTIQDLQQTKLCSRTGMMCTNKTFTCVVSNLGSWELVGSPSWYTPTTISDLFSIISGNPGSTITLVAGDTGRGQTLPQLTLAI